MSKIISQIEKDSIRKLIASGERTDGRKFDEYRQIKIETGKFKRAEGSASARIGNTYVASGIKLGKGEPYSDSPDKGVLITNAELVPMASPLFQPGPPDENAIELARVVDRGIRESQAIELEKLCIEPGVETRIVYIDAYVLDYDGNFIDATSLAAVAALHNAEIPEFGKLPVVKKPVANTFIKVGNEILVDPSLEEERVMDARLTVTIEDNGMICAMQKSGIGFFTSEEVMKCIKTAGKTSREIRKLI